MVRSRDLDPLKVAGMAVRTHQVLPWLSLFLPSAGFVPLTSSALSAQDIARDTRLLDWIFACLSLPFQKDGVTVEVSLLACERVSQIGPQHRRSSTARSA